jgi:transposase-like protein
MARQETSVTFVPPRCPHRDCEAHHRPAGRFFIRSGCYVADCHDQPVPRFRCRLCKRSFSRQTFRHSRSDRRPECNVPLLQLLVSGVGLRKAAEMLRLDLHSVQRKKLKIGATCRLMHANLCTRLPEGRTYLLDEEESYERLSIRPLTVPLLIEHRTWFVVAATAGSIRRLAPRGTRRRAWQERDERKHGRRPDESSATVELVLRELARRTSGSLILRSDEKRTYATIGKRVFGTRLAHVTTSGRAPRNRHNPLFAINNTIAMTRCYLGRLRRRSWLVSKNKERLQNHLHIYIAYRNYVRRRFQRDEAQRTPAVELRLLPRNLTFAETLGWRQDWADRSPHPLSSDGTRSIGDLDQAA